MLSSLFLLLFICVCVCVYVSVYVLMHTFVYIFVCGCPWRPFFIINLQEASVYLYINLFLYINIYFFFHYKVPGWPRINRDLSVYASRVLGLKVCATAARLHLVFIWFSFVC